MKPVRPCGAQCGDDPNRSTKGTGGVHVCVIRSMNPASESGQALVLGVWGVAIAVTVLLLGAAIGLVEAQHAAVQSAADAAALACASRATVARQVDARGVVYGVSVRVAADRGAVAAAAVWSANVDSLPVRTLQFQAVAVQASCRVRASVAARGWLGALVRSPGRVWRVEAAAMAHVSHR